jgi:hypothetical protein
VSAAARRWCRHPHPMASRAQVGAERQARLPCLPSREQRRPGQVRWVGWKWMHPPCQRAWGVPALRSLHITRSVGNWLGSCSRNVRPEQGQTGCRHHLILGALSPQHCPSVRHPTPELQARRLGSVHSYRQAGCGRTSHGAQPTYISLQGLHFGCSIATYNTTGYNKTVSAARTRWHRQSAGPECPHS